MQTHLLALLLLQPERDWTLDELAKVLSSPVSSVHRELRRAWEAGVITRDDRVRPHRFRAEQSSAAYPPLRDLLQMTQGVQVRLAAELEPLGVIAASIHGSWVRGRLRPDSDLDVLVVADEDHAAVRRAIARVAREASRQPDAVVLASAEFRNMVRSGNPFIGKLLSGARQDVVGSLSTVAGRGDAGRARVAR